MTTSKPNEIDGVSRGVCPSCGLNAWEFIERMRVIMNKHISAIAADTQEIDKLRVALKHPLYVFSRQAIAEGRVLTKLMPPDAGGVKYAGFYCQDYDGPVDGLAP
jgi:hypothetical protein